MSTSARDLVIGAVACAVLVYFFIRIELVELVFDWTRQHEAWDLDEILAGAPALAVVAAWFAIRRRREAVELNVRLAHNVAELREEIRRRRALQEQLREAYKVAAVGTVAGGLAHELNDVLQPIVTLAQLHADRADTPEEVRTGMRHIHEAAERGRDIVRHSLSFTTGGIRDTEEVALRQWLDEFVARARESAPGGVTFTTRLGGDAGSVGVNAGELEHVMDNLLANAVEAMKQRGTVIVALDTCAIEAEDALAQGLTVGDYFRVTVSDEGPGMAAEVQRHVFDPFFTTKTGTRGGGDGTGLGLAVVYRLVRGWEGNITVRSEPGAGATFTLLIPRLGSRD